MRTAHKGRRPIRQQRGTSPNLGDWSVPKKGCLHRFGLYLAAGTIFNNTRRNFIVDFMFEKTDIEEISYSCGSMHLQELI